MAPRSSCPISKTPYPRLPVNAEGRSLLVHLEDEPATRRRRILDHVDAENAMVRERVSDLLRVYSSHVVKRYEDDAWRVAPPKSGAVPPVQPVNSRYEATYRKCFEMPRSYRGLCCANECSMLMFSRRPCKFCYPMEHSSYGSESSLATHSPPCRCSCKIYQHDVMWTPVGQGDFYYKSPNARMCSFIDPRTGRETLSFRSIATIELVEDGFAMVPEDECIHPTIRCHACLFTVKMTKVFSRQTLNKEHGRYSPFCAFVSRPFDTEAITPFAQIFYHRGFMSMRAINYVPDKTCPCYAIRTDGDLIL